MKNYTKSWLLFGLVGLLLAACNKGNDQYIYTDEFLSINFKGYNATSEQLLLSVDTILSKQQINARGAFNVSEAFTFKGDQQTVKIYISEKSTGKQLLEKEIDRSEGIASYSFLYMDGKLSDMPEKPAVADGKISLIYMFLPNETKYNEPVDFAMGKYYSTPAVFEELARIKNVKPNEFGEAATIPTFSTARQDYNGVMTSVSFQIRIYKTGTNIPYTEGTAYTWSNISSTAPRPSASTASSKLYIFSEAPFGTQMRFGTILDF